MHDVGCCQLYRTCALCKRYCRALLAARYAMDADLYTRGRTEGAVDDGHLRVYGQANKHWVGLVWICCLIHSSCKAMLVTCKPCSAVHITSLLSGKASHHTSTRANSICHGQRISQRTNTKFRVFTMIHQICCLRVYLRLIPKPSARAG